MKPFQPWHRDSMPGGLGGGAELGPISSPWQGLYVVSYTTEFEGLYYVAELRR